MSSGRGNVFCDEELGDYYKVLRNNQEFTELECGCTVTKYGDTPGKLRVYRDGRFEVECTCRARCNGANLSPAEFARHAGRSNSRQEWKTQIWVFKNDGRKVPLSSTCFLRYQYQTDMFQRPKREIRHRDEFIQCCQCGKERRFFLRSKEECKVYHEALAQKYWTCVDMPNQVLTCDDAEERKSRKGCRGCPKSIKCTGCENCVCYGCQHCRFADCVCSSCVEFVQNNLL